VIPGGLLFDTHRKLAIEEQNMKTFFNRNKTSTDWVWLNPGDKVFIFVGPEPNAKN
jgi:hypothetical protein